jgi:hypothetical protein
VYVVCTALRVHPVTVTSGTLCCRKLEGFSKPVKQVKASATLRKRGPFSIAQLLRDHTSTAPLVPMPPPQLYLQAAPAGSSGPLSLTMTSGESIQQLQARARAAAASGAAQAAALADDPAEDQAIANLELHLAKRLQEYVEQKMQISTMKPHMQPTAGHWGCGTGAGPLTGPIAPHGTSIPAAPASNLLVGVQQGSAQPVPPQGIAGGDSDFEIDDAEMERLEQAAAAAMLERAHASDVPPRAHLPQSPAQACFEQSGFDQAATGMHKGHVQDFGLQQHLRVAPAHSLSLAGEQLGGAIGSEHVADMHCTAMDSYPAACDMEFEDHSSPAEATTGWPDLHAAQCMQQRAPGGGKDVAAAVPGASAAVEPRLGGVVAGFEEVTGTMLAALLHGNNADLCDIDFGDDDDNNDEAMCQAAPGMAIGCPPDAAAQPQPTVLPFASQAAAAEEDIDNLTIDAAAQVAQDSMPGGCELQLDVDSGFDESCGAGEDTDELAGTRADVLGSSPEGALAGEPALDSAQGGGESAAPDQAAAQRMQAALQTPAATNLLHKRKRNFEPHMLQVYLCPAILVDAEDLIACEAT